MVSPEFGRIRRWCPRNSEGTELEQLMVLDANEKSGKK